MNGAADINSMNGAESVTNTNLSNNTTSTNSQDNAGATNNISIMTNSNSINGVDDSNKLNSVDASRNKNAVNDSNNLNAANNTSILSKSNTINAADNIGILSNSNTITAADDSNARERNNALKSSKKNIASLIDLDNEACLRFEQRLLKNNNDFKDYLSFLRANLSDSRYEILVFLYLRLILNYGHGAVLITEFWNYYISVLNITNDNFRSLISDDLLERLNSCLDLDSVVKMMNFFLSSNLFNLFDYNFSKLISRANFEKNELLFEKLIIKDLEVLSDDRTSDLPSLQYPQFFKLESLFKKVLFLEGDNVESDTWLSGYIMKYIILLKSRNKFTKEKKASLSTLLIKTGSLEDLALYFKKLEHDNVRYLYCKLWIMATQQMDLRERSQYLNLASADSTFLAKASFQDVLIIRKLILVLSCNKNHIETVIKSTIQDIEQSRDISEFQELYDFLIFILKLNINHRSFDDQSMDWLEDNVKLYKSRKLKCKLKSDGQEFNYWREYLIFNKYSKESIEFCLKVLDFNKSGNKIKNVRANELGDLWIKYAQYYEHNQESLRAIVRMCFRINFSYWSDFENVVVYWINYELKHNSYKNLFEKIIKYSDAVSNRGDNFNILLRKSFRIWDLCLKNIAVDLQLTTFKKMSLLNLIKPETILFISSQLLENTNVDFDEWVNIWKENITINFRDYNYIVRYLYDNFVKEVDTPKLNVDQYTKYSIKRDFLKHIIGNSDKKVIPDWVLIYLDLIIAEEKDEKNAAYLLNTLLFQTIQNTPSETLLVKWIEVLSNLKNKSIDAKFLKEIRAIQFPTIVNLFANEVLIKTGFFTDYIQFESNFESNEQRIRDVYIIAVTLLPPNFNEHMEKLWTKFQDFELQHGHLKDYINLKKEVTIKFKNMGYSKQKEDGVTTTVGAADHGGIQFVSGGLVNSNKRQKLTDQEVSVKTEEHIEQME